MTDAPPPRCSSGTEQPLAWHCCDDRYPWIKDIVTTNPLTLDAWRDSGIKFQPLYPRDVAQTWPVRLPFDILNLVHDGIKNEKSSPEITDGIMGLINDCRASTVSSTDREGK